MIQKCYLLTKKITMIKDARKEGDAHTTGSLLVKLAP